VSPKAAIKFIVEPGIVPLLQRANEIPSRLKKPKASLHPKSDPTRSPEIIDDVAIYDLCCQKGP
jgi:hypothetical protein